MLLTECLCNCSYVIFVLPFCLLFLVPVFSDPNEFTYSGMNWPNAAASGLLVNFYLRIQRLIYSGVSDARNGGIWMSIIGVGGINGGTSGIGGSEVIGVGGSGEQAAGHSTNKLWSCQLIEWGS